VHTCACVYSTSPAAQVGPLSPQEVACLGQRPRAASCRAARRGEGGPRAGLAGRSDRQSGKKRRPPSARLPASEKGDLELESAASFLQIL